MDGPFFHNQIPHGAPLESSAMTVIEGGILITW